LTPKYFSNGLQHSITSSNDVLPLVRTLRENPDASIVDVQTVARLTSEQLTALAYLFTTAETDVFDRQSDFVTDDTQSEYLSNRTAVLSASQALQAGINNAEQITDGVLEDLAHQTSSVTVTQLDEQISATQAAYAGVIAKQSELVAKATVGVAAAQQSLGVITAPFAGVVTKVLAKEGEYVNVGAPLMTLVGSGARELEVSVPSYLLDKVKVGQAFMVGGQTVGTVDRFSSLTTGGSGVVIISLTSADALPVGSSVSGYLEVNSDTSVYQVPRTYLHFSNNGPYLLYANGQRSGVEIVYDVGTDFFVKPEIFTAEALQPATSISIK
jgi:biotin carboxyl carrier protein